MAKLTMPDLEKILAVTLSGMTVSEFNHEVTKWIATARHPRFKRPYTEMVYQPMLELLQYIRANGFKTYIVTGGGQDFVRTYSQQVYGIPPEQVVKEIMLKPMPKGTFITFEELAGITEFLIGPAARNITGQTIIVDGGWTVQ